MPRKVAQPSYEFKFNKSNWTGEEATMAVCPANRVLVLRGIHNDAGRNICFRWTSKGTAELGLVYRFTELGKDEPEFIVFELDEGYYCCESSDISREGNNPFVVMAQVLWNLT